jgi:hypothetical protein
MRHIWQLFFMLFVMAAGTVGGLAQGKAQEGPKDILPRKSSARVLPAR